MRVLVIGGGIGGLCLAHGLRAAGVDGAGLRARAHPRRLAAGLPHPHQPGRQPALHACLPRRAVGRVRGRRADRGGDGFAFRDEQLRTLVLHPGRAAGRRPGRPGGPAPLGQPDPAAQRAARRPGRRDRVRPRVRPLRADPGWTGDRALRRRQPRPPATCWSVRTAPTPGSASSTCRTPGGSTPGCWRWPASTRCPARSRLPDALLATPNNIVPPRSSWMFTATWRAGPARARRSRPPTSRTTCSGPTRPPRTASRPTCSTGTARPAAAGPGPDRVLVARHPDHGGQLGPGDGGRRCRSAPCCRSSRGRRAR